MENVTGLLKSLNNGKVKELIFKSFEEIGYRIDTKVLDSKFWRSPI